MRTFSKSEAARKLRVSTRTVQRLISRGRLPATRFGGQIRIQRGDLAAMAALRRTASMDPLTALDKSLDDSIAAARAAAKGEFSSATR